MREIRTRVFANAWGDFDFYPAPERKVSVTATTTDTDLLAKWQKLILHTKWDTFVGDGNTVLCAG